MNKQNPLDNPIQFVRHHENFDGKVQLKKEKTFPFTTVDGKIERISRKEMIARTSFRVDVMRGDNGDILQYQHFQLADVKQLIVEHVRCWKKNGEFRRFALSGFLLFNNGKKRKIGTEDMRRLKRELKPFAITIEKRPQVERKKGAERKALDYTYYF